MRNLRVRSWLAIAASALFFGALASCANTLTELPKTSAPAGGGGVAVPSGPILQPLTVGDKSVTLKWSAVTGATSYSIFYSTSSAGATSASTNKVTGLTGTSTTLSYNGSSVLSSGVGSTVAPGSLALSNNTMFYFTVVAVVAGVQSSPAPYLSAKPSLNGGIASPDSTLIASTVASESITLTWGAVSGATSYNLYYSTAPNAVTTTSTNRVTGIPGTSITLTTSGQSISTSVTAAVVNDGSLALVNGTSYQFILTAVNSEGEGAGSSPFSGTPAAPTVKPDAPQLSVPTASSLSVSLVWAPVAGASSYDIYYGTTSGAAILIATNTNKITGLTATATKLTNSGTTIASSGAGGVVNAGSTPLLNGTAFYFVVVAKNSVGPSSISNVQSATPTNFLAGNVQSPAVIGGDVSNFAGVSGSSGYTTGSGSAARFGSIQGMTTDGTYLWVIDSFTDATIRKISLATASVTNIANGGVGFGSPTDLVSDGKFLYLTASTGIRVFDQQTETLKVLTGAVAGSTPIDGGPQVAVFNDPWGITTDGVNLYVTDRSAHNIRMVVIATGEVTTLAGPMNNGSGSTDGAGAGARFSYPEGITTDGTNLYVADSGNNTIRKVVISSGVVTTLTGNIHARRLAIDGMNLYVADYDNYIVQKVSLATGEKTTLAGVSGTYGSTNAFGTSARFGRPNGVATDGISLYVSDYGNFTIRKIK